MSIEGELVPFPGDDVAAGAAHPDVDELVQSMGEKQQRLYRRYLAIEAARESTSARGRSPFPPATRALGRTLTHEDGCPR